MLDALARAGYRIAYRVLRLWWRVTRPFARGVAVAVVHDRRLLVVRQSFREGLGLPAGGHGEREEPRAAALRELVEETGLRPDPAELRHDGTLRLVFEHRKLEVEVFSWEAPSPPRVLIDNREIVEAMLLTRSQLRAGALLHPSLRWWLDRYGDRLVP